MRKRTKHKHNMGSNNRQPSFSGSGLIRHMLLLAAILYLGINTYTICMFHHQTRSSASRQDDGDAPGVSSEQQHHQQLMQRLNATESQRIDELSQIILDKLHERENNTQSIRSPNKVQINNNTIRKGKGKQRSQGPPNMPDNWTTMDFFDIRNHFTCKRYAHNTNKPLPTLADWQFFIDRYKKVVDKDANFDNAVLPTDGYDFDGNGSPPPWYAAIGKRGRGLFASRNITKGELVHDGDRSDFIFPDGMSWRRYIFSLPRKKACDMIDWTWTQKDKYDNEKYNIYSSMNIAILCNGGNDKTININANNDTSSKMYALRDIMKDEELLSDYEMYDTVWNRVGLGDDDDEFDDDDGGFDDDDRGLRVS